MTKKLRLTDKKTMKNLNKYWLFVLLILFIFSSCDFLKSKDKLLTKDKWVLWASWTDSIHKTTPKEPKSILHKLSDADLTLSFSSDGIVEITEDNGKKSETVRWNWTNDDKEKLHISNGNFEGDFSIFSLDGKELGFLKLDFTSNISQSWSFRHPDGDWSDSAVESINKHNENTK